MVSKLVLPIAVPLNTVFTNGSPLKFRFLPMAVHCHTGFCKKKIHGNTDFYKYMKKYILIPFSINGIYEAKKETPHAIIKIVI